MNNLNEKMIKKFRENIAISNLREECNMKKIMKKQIVMFCMLGIVFVTGGFFTVNAATGGELVDNIKKDIKDIFLDKVKSYDAVEVDEDTFELESYDTDENGNVINARYNFKDEKGNWFVVQEGELTEDLVTEE